MQSLRYVLAAGTIVALGLGGGLLAGTARTEPTQQVDTWTVSVPTTRVVTMTVEKETPPPVEATAVRLGKPWECDRRVNLDVVRVTDPPDDAIRLLPGCEGTIRRVEVEGVEKGAGILVMAEAENVLITGGSVSCDGGLGAQVNGGTDIRISNVAFDCGLVIEASGEFLPAGVVCDHCALGRGATVTVGKSLASGIRNSLVCATGERPIRTRSSAEYPINEDNVTVPVTDDRCDQAGLIAFTNG